MGIGAGTLAAYGRPGDYFRLYEIDRAIVDLSRGDRPIFTFVQASASHGDAVMGDARVSMQEELLRGEPQDFDVLVVDAFSGDTIPVHLLTREAMDLYLRQLHSPESVVAFHLSNSTLDLRPVIEGLARAHGMTSLEFDSPPMLRLPSLAAEGRTFESNVAASLWTDDHTNLYELFSW